MGSGHFFLRITGCSACLERRQRTCSWCVLRAPKGLLSAGIKATGMSNHHKAGMLASRAQHGKVIMLRR